MDILAVTGTNGSGKGTFVRFLEDEGYIHYSARDLIIQEIQKRGLEKDRNATNLIGNTLRKENGPDYVVRELLRQANESGEKKVIIESVRCPGEVHFLKQHGALLLAVDDPVSVRYERITKRASETDKVTLEEFLFQEERECTGIEEWDMNVPACIREADYIFTDNGDIESFRKKVHLWVAKHIRTAA